MRRRIHLASLRMRSTRDQGSPIIPVFHAIVECGMQTMFAAVCAPLHHLVMQAYVVN